MPIFALVKIALVGYMGTGKSTLGRRLARQLDLPFLDTDTLLEQTHHCTVAKLFERGEAHFRQCECDLKPFLEKLPDAVLATGGGFPCHDQLMTFLLNHFTVVYLRADAHFILSRLTKGIEKRPLLASLAPEERHSFIVKHLALRKVYYEKAPIIVEAKSVNIRELLVLWT